MSINAKYLVSLTPRVISGGSSDLETNGMVLTKSTLLPSTSLAMSFGSATAVADFFGQESDEAAFAQQYFTGLTNQQHAPSALIFGRRVAEAAPAYVRTPTYEGTLADLKAVTAGRVSLMVNGEEASSAAVNLSSATSLSDAAAKIGTALGVTGTYDSTLQAFTFTTEETGEDATVAFADAPTGSGTDLNEMLGLSEAAGAVLSQGMAAMTESANLDSITAATANWSQFTTLWEVTEAEEAEGYAAWADTDDDYVYVFWSSDSKMTSALTQESTVAYTLNGTYDCTFMIYAPDYSAAAFALAYPASIAWQQNQGMKVLFGKTASGITPTVTDQSEAEALDDLRVSYVGQFATRNAEFEFANRGALASDFYGWYDVLIGMIWLRSKIQRSIMDGFSSVNRVPYNTKGYTIIQAWIQDPINAAKKVGVIDEGIALSESQKAQIMQELGDSEAPDDIETNGFYLQIEDPEANVRAERGTPVMNLYYAYAGSVQKVEMPVTAVL